MTTIAIVNESTVLTDAEVAPVVTALQTQVTRDFEAAWGIGAQLKFLTASERPAPTDWVLALLDDSDQAGALGYHDVTATGQPLGKSFAKTDADYGLSWSVTVSHELLEMLGDPDVNLTTFIQRTAGAGVLYSYEVCDAVEDDSFAYAINGVRVSDFVLPAYFQTFRAGPFDHQGLLPAPVPHLLRGGYIGAFEVGSGGGWQQIFAPEESKMADRARLDRGFHRRVLRRKPRDEWKRSTAHRLWPAG